jgi:hypothetical protein
MYNKWAECVGELLTSSAWWVLFIIMSWLGILGGGVSMQGVLIHNKWVLLLWIN